MFLLNMPSKSKNAPLASEVALERLEDVLRTINEGPKTAHSRRVEEIMSWLQKLTEKSSTLERAGALAKLRGLLGRYRWVSYIAPSTDGLIVFNGVADHNHLSREALWEHLAVRDLLAAFPQLGFGTRPYLRRCERATCGSWFIAPRSDTRACKRTCYQWLRDSSPEERARKAAKMRDHREKERKRAALEAVRAGFPGVSAGSFRRNPVSASQ